MAATRRLQKASNRLLLIESRVLGMTNATMRRYFRVSTGFSLQKIHTSIFKFWIYFSIRICY